MGQEMDQYSKVHFAYSEDVSIAVYCIRKHSRRAPLVLEFVSYTDMNINDDLKVRNKSEIVSPAFFTHDGVSSLDWDPFLNTLETQMRQAARRERVVLHRNYLHLLYDFRNRKCVDPRDEDFEMFAIIENN